VSDDLDAFFSKLISPNPERPPGEDFFAVTFCVDDMDCGCRHYLTVAGSWQSITSHFNISQLPPDTVLRQGDAAREYLQESARKETQFRQDQLLRSLAGGVN
jgi:hypothetical protein